MVKKLKVFEAFAGVGSQSMALRNISVNYEIVGTMDVDKYAILSYDSIHNKNIKINIPTKDEILKEINEKHIAYNFSTGKSEIPKKEEDLIKLYEAHMRNKNYGDIRLINVIDLPHMDFFTYSFPCKNISNAGQQAGFDEGSGTQSSLIWECKKIIESKKPKYLMMENVKNLISKNHKLTFDKWCSLLEDLGYNNYWKLLNGKNFGVPQNRERVIMISIRKDIDDGLFVMPETNGKIVYLKDLLEYEVSDKYYIDESKYKNFITRDFCDCENELLQVGLLEIKGNESTRRIYSENGISPCLNSMNGGNRQPKIFVKEKTKQGELVDCGKVRKLTELECWRIQGFKDEDFFKAKSSGLPSSKLYERAGRGIVVPMLEEIFKLLFGEYIC